MSHTIYVGKISKRKNSTLQPTLTTSFDVLLKTPTSLHTPTFTISASSFDYNYIKWGDRYYFVTDVVSRNNSLWEVSAVCDVLATFKTDILASTQFVSYSSASGGTWLADTRIPLLKSGTVQKNVSTMNFLFTAGGFYVLSVIGDSGSKVWATDITNLKRLVNNVSQWTNTLVSNIQSMLPYASPVTDMQAYQNMTQALIGTGTLGNAYLDAPNCIRSCIWVPFFISDYIGSSGSIYLGAFDTGATGYECQTTPHANSLSINIPWQHSDWRRAVCEEVYLYLPLVGMVNIPSDEIVNETALTIEWSATATDGTIAFCIKAGNQIVGAYGANCAVNYPIGISQQASAGEIVQTAFAGLQKSVSSGIHAKHPLAGAATKADFAFNTIDAVYDTIDTALTRHNSCIGGIGGGAGVGLDLDATVYTVSHDTIVTPSAMQQTMGLPTMKPMALATLTGYCQCANAHVSAPAEAQELDEIDAYLNGGFYIE